MMMMMIVVDDNFGVNTSTQFITVPLRLVLTGLISSLDITGLSSADVLDILNVVELTTNSGITTLGGPEETMMRENSVAVVSFPRITLNLHSSWLPGTVHINSSSSPLHTRAITAGDIVTVPALRITILELNPADLRQPCQFLSIQHDSVAIPSMPLLPHNSRLYTKMYVNDSGPALSMTPGRTSCHQFHE